MTGGDAGVHDGGAGDEMLARVALTRVAEPGDEVVGHYVERLGAARAWQLVRDGSLPRVSRTRLEGYLTRARDCVPERDLHAAAAVGARFVCPGEPEWPTQLDDLGAARPIGLWLRGPANLRLLAVRSVAVVGARAATGYGEHVAGDLSAGLAERGWAVVSGGAYGIDAAAHRGALAVDGDTVAVLACGIDQWYPRGNDALLARVGDSGVVVSELPPGCHPTRSRFLVRNRVIAALTRATVVVEAADRSGALSTAGHARRLNRPVLVVPGPVTSPMSAGCHRWVREEGGQLVTSVDDIVEMVGRIGVDLAPEPAREHRTHDDLDPVTSRVLEAVPVRRPVSVASIARTAGVSDGETLRGLASLHVSGLVESVDGGWRLTAAGRGSASAAGHSQA